MVTDYNRRVRGVEIGHTPSSLVYFFCTITKIISSWNSEGCLISNADLRREVESKYGQHIAESEWTIMLNSFAAEQIGHKPNTMRFLLYAASEDQLIINYPTIEAFLNSESGQEFVNSVEMLEGTSLRYLRKPEEDNEKQWVAWLKTNFPPVHLEYS